jgi:hypothetical protein
MQQEKNCWSRRFLCGSCCTTGTYIILSSQKFLIYILWYRIMSLKFSFTPEYLYAFLISVLMCYISHPLSYSVRHTNLGYPHYAVFLQNSVSSYFSGKGLAVSCSRTPSNALSFPSYELKKAKKTLRGLSLRANYTDRETTACRRS